MKNAPITRQGQVRQEMAAIEASSKNKRIDARTKAIEANKTDKKYTLFHRNVPVVNWDTLGVLRRWMAELGSSAFIHYNESGIEDYQNQKVKA